MTKREVARAARNEFGDLITVQVTPEVQAAIDRWALDHGEDLNERLAPLGLGNYNIVRPVYRRIVLEGEPIAEAIDALSKAGVTDATDVAAAAVAVFKLTSPEAGA